jgi:heme O synthase-like polyprenyltransferase
VLLASGASALITTDAGAARAAGGPGSTDSAVTAGAGGATIGASAGALEGAAAPSAGALGRRTAARSTGEDVTGGSSALITAAVIAVAETADPSATQKCARARLWVGGRIRCESRSQPDVRGPEISVES